MSLDHILIGLLREPASGYDLKKRFEQSVRHFWSAELSQIYPALRKLEGQGLLQSTTEASPRGPDRHIYRITRKGRGELRRWLRGGPQFGAERFAYLAQLYLLDELGSPQDTRQFMCELREHLVAWGAQLQEIEKQILATAAGDALALPPRAFHPYCTLRMGIRTIRAKVEWCDEIIEMVDARQAQAQGARHA